jgi:hypothetical protein
VAADTQTIGSALIQEFEGKERVVAYLSRKLLDPETRYSTAKKLCLCVFFEGQTVGEIPTAILSLKARVNRHTYRYVQERESYTRDSSH